MWEPKTVIPGQKAITCGERVRKLFVLENWVTDGNKARNWDPERRNKFKWKKVNRHEISPACYQDSGYSRSNKLQGADNSCSQFR